MYMCVGSSFKIKPNPEVITIEKPLKMSTNWENIAGEKQK